MKEQIKIGLLAVIAVTLVINTFFMQGASSVSGGSAKATPQSSLAANNNQVTPTPADPFSQQQKQEPAKPTGPITAVNFKKMAHDFGNIKQNTENEFVFSFTNTGGEPLLIENAKGSCGCTVPEYPTEPIPPGESGEIKVVYKPGNQKGSQQKTVTVLANTEPKETLLSISAMVEELAAAAE